MAEFSDQPVILPPNEKMYHGFFPAKHITKYLEEYLDSHVYNGKSLRERVLLQTKVNTTASPPALKVLL